MESVSTSLTGEGRSPTRERYLASRLRKNYKILYSRSCNDKKIGSNLVSVLVHTVEKS